MGMRNGRISQKWGRNISPPFDRYNSETINEMIDRNQIDLRVKKVVSDLFLIEDDSLQGYHYLWDDLNADDLDLFLLIDLLETEFKDSHLEMNDVTFKRNTTVINIIDEIDSILNSQKEIIIEKNMGNFS